MMTGLKENPQFERSSEAIEDFNSLEKEKTMDQIEEIMQSLVKIGDFFDCDEEKTPRFNEGSEPSIRDVMVLGLPIIFARDYVGLRKESPRRSLDIDRWSAVFSRLFYSYQQETFLNLSTMPIPISNREFIKLLTEGEELTKIVKTDLYGNRIIGRAPTPKEIFRYFQNSYARVVMLAIEYDIKEVLDQLGSNLFIKEQGSKRDVDYAYLLCLTLRHGEKYVPNNCTQKLLDVRDYLLSKYRWGQLLG